jgi:hypothetical protein
MSIRLVNDAGEVFWFTSGNWRRVLAFASRHGWSLNPSLEPDNWDEALTWNEHYEIVGGAAVAEAESRELADAIERGVTGDPAGDSVAAELAIRAEDIRRKLPEYDPARHAVDLLHEWARFQAFARRGAFRVDLTD